VNGKQLSMCVNLDGLTYGFSWVSTLAYPNLIGAKSFLMFLLLVVILSCMHVADMYPSIFEVSQLVILNSIQSRICCSWTCLFRLSLKYMYSSSLFNWLFCLIIQQHYRAYTCLLIVFCCFNF
jgi:hypothetical protein